MMQHWWERQNVRWAEGGGYVAARLWWLAFFLLMGSFLLAQSLLMQGDNHKWQSTRSLSSLKQIGTALVMYTQDYDEVIPPMATTATLRTALTPYKPGDIWTIEQGAVPYATNASLSYYSLNDYPKPAEIVAVWDTRLFSQKYHAVAFLDGHAKMVPEPEWTQLRMRSGIVRDVPPPPEPFWWSTRTREDFGLYTLLTLLLIGVGAALGASWLEAWQGSGQRGAAFVFYLIGWLVVRFFGYGFLVLAAAGITGFALSLLLPVVSV